MVAAPPPEPLQPIAARRHVGLRSVQHFELYCCSRRWWRSIGNDSRRRNRRIKRARVASVGLKAMRVTPVGNHAAKAVYHRVAGSCSVESGRMGRAGSRHQQSPRSVFSVSALAERLAFRGGTALYKLHLRPPARYSEDIDLVQIRAEPIGGTLDLVRGALDPWLGTSKHRLRERSATLVYRFDSEDDPPLRIRLKIEINTRSTSPSWD